MNHVKLPAVRAVSCAVLFLIGGMAHAQSLVAPGQGLEARLDALTQELLEQKKLLAQLQSMQQQFAEQRGLIEALERQVAQQQTALSELRGTVAWDVLAMQRGAGKVGDPEQVAQAQVKESTPVGQSPSSDGRPPEVAPIFEQPGVLTQPNHYVLEPSVQFGYSSSNRVALVGYTIIPALLIGLIDVREIKRNTMTGALSARFGITNRLELEVRAPFVYRSDSNVTRPYGDGKSFDTEFGTNGIGIGDIELGARYQLNDGGVDKPFYIGSLRIKTRTGKDPFEVVTSCTISCGSPGTDATTGLPLELPTGSGFYSAQVGLTVLYPSDPAVFFGGVTYTHNFPRDNVSRKVLGGESEMLGTIAPGDIVGFNFGMGLALNEKSSFSIGYDHSSVGRTRVNGEIAATSVRTQLATLLIGYSYRLSKKTTLNLSVGAGLTRDTPDVSLTVRLPMTF